VPEITKLIVNGMSKSKMQKSDEACIIHDAQNQTAKKVSLKICSNISINKYE
jgi:hypothetical protein